MYVFINPKDAAPNEPKVTWNEAQKEIAAAKGFSVKDSSLSKGKNFSFYFIFMFFFNFINENSNRTTNNPRANN